MIADIVALMIELVSRHNISCFLVEYQGMSRRLAVQQGAFLSAAYCNGVQEVRVVNALSVKAHFRGALGCRGNRQNKLDAERYVRQLGYTNYVSHIADCILMCLHRLDQEQQ
jgi:hypothetical protein